MKLIQRNLQTLQEASLWLILALLFLMQATNPRQIWTDEVLQFIFGSFSDSGLAARLISQTVSGVNHGQTGAHMFLNHLLLKWFGASYFVLRAPSYCAYAAGLLAGLYYLRNLGFSYLVRLCFVLGLGCSHLNLVHGGEARPYVFLEAGVLLFLWAYERFLSRNAGAWLPGLAAAFGMLFHPFFVAYLGLVFIGAILFSRDARARMIDYLRAKDAWQRVGGLCAILLLEFFVLGRFSWMKNLGHYHGLNPYEFVGHTKSLPRFMLGTFFYPFGIASAVLLCAFGCWAFWRRKQETISPLIPWLLTLLLTLVVSQFVIVQSVLRSSYWILQRQWIAGNALAFFLASFLLEIFFRSVSLPQRGRQILPIFLFLFGSFLVSRAILDHIRHPMVPVVPLEQSDQLLAQRGAKEELQESDFTILAHQNLMQGGPVWKVFQRYYSVDLKAIGAREE